MEAAVTPTLQDDVGADQAKVSIQSSEAPAEQVYQTVKFLLTADDAQSLTNALTPGATVDALNLPSDAPLVVIQREETDVGDDDDDDGDDDDDVLDNYPADPKLRKTHARKVKFGMKCEWVGCKMKGGDEGPMFKCNELISHVKEHLLDVRDKIQKLLLDDDGLINGQTDEANPLFKCMWEDCGFVPVRPAPTNNDAKPIDAQFEELTRHVFFHVFHSKLKYLGKVVMDRNRLERCQFSVDSRNLIPELPDRMRCDWSVCDFAFDNPISFYAHVAQHVDDLPASSTLKCKWGDCKKSIKRRGHMKEHMRVHTQEKTVGCPQCGGMFANKTKFSDHIVRQQSEAVQIFHCQYCSKKFGLERLLRDHMRQHVNHYKCPLCDMTCAFPANLRHHIQYKHSEYRPHCCPRCPYMAKTQYDLTKHMNNHELEETYECDAEGCDYSSVSLECYKAHQREHDLREAGIAKRRFQCHVCLKEFTRGTNLTSHLKNNHNVKWPEGLKRFKYVLYEDGFYRLQAVRYESIELTQQLMQSQQTESTTTTATAVTTTTTTARDSHSPAGNAVTDLRDGMNFEGSSAFAPPQSSANSTSPATPVNAQATDVTRIGGVATTSGNENLEMLGDVASLLQTPTKKSLTQRKTTRSKRKRGEDEPTTSTPATTPNKMSPTKKIKREVIHEQHLDVPVVAGGSSALEGGKTELVEKMEEDEDELEEEDDGILYKLVDAGDVTESPFSTPVSSVASYNVVFAAAVSTPPSTASTTIPGSVEAPVSCEVVGPGSVESDATHYHLVSSVGSNDSSLLYRLTDGGVTSVGSSSATTDRVNIVANGDGEDADDRDDGDDHDDDDDDDDYAGPSSSVAEVDAMRNPRARTFQQLRAAAVVDSPGFLSSPEETVLFRLADSIELPDELVVDSPLAIVHPAPQPLSSTASTDEQMLNDAGNASETIRGVAVEEQQEEEEEEEEEEEGGNRRNSPETVLYTLKKPEIHF